MSGCPHASISSNEQEGVTYQKTRLLNILRFVELALAGMC